MQEKHVSLDAGTTRAAADWQRELARSITDLETLCRALRLDPVAVGASDAAARTFPLRVPRPYLERMEPGRPDDPLLRQILPSEQETRNKAGFDPDPLRETSACRQKGLLQKYPHRVLLAATDACGIHCRYCFRRHRRFSAVRDLRPALATIADDPHIEEVILSGGDPLMLDDASLKQVFYYIEEIPHVKRVRIHSRLPVVLPQRMTPSLLGLLADCRKPLWVVFHVNHAVEISSEVEKAFLELSRAGVPLLSQTVLLRGVNDRADVLQSLFERLIAMRVVPYYLHQMDRVVGTAHFEVAVEEGKRLIEQLRTRLPGFAVPRYVREVPGVPHKVILA